MRTSRSPGAHRPRSVASSVVFPEPVAPLIRKLKRRSSIRSSTPCTLAPNIPFRRSSSMEKTRSRRILILRRVPAVEMGGRTAWTRKPPSSLMSTQGEPSSRRRPPAATSRAASARTCGSPEKATGALSRPSPRSSQTAPGPLTKMSVTDGSRTSACSGPRPFNSALIPSTAAKAPAVPSRRPLACTAAATRDGVTGPASDITDSRTDSRSRASTVARAGGRYRGTPGRPLTSGGPGAEWALMRGVPRRTQAPCRRTAAHCAAVRCPAAARSPWRPRPSGRPA